MKIKNMMFYNTDWRRGATKYWDYEERTIRNDTLANFTHNRKKLGPEWYYYDKGDISYVYNKQGFRTLEFDNLDWSNCIVLFGCSIVEGTGNPIENTIGHYLDEFLGIPVVNFGVSGSAVDFSAVNSLLLYEYGIRPKAVVHLWTSLDRYTNFMPRYDVRHYQIHKKDNEYYLDHNWDIRSKNYIIADRALWKSHTRYYEATFFKLTSAIMDIDFIQYEDRARDLSHPGYETNKKAAESIAKNLILQGIE